jgi:glycerophosphoryl diester phosphodiesterase
MRLPYTLPKVIGHRGAAGRAPENTLAGFAEAARLGVTWVEFDVMLSADGVPVVHHDHDLARTAGGPGRVAELSYAEIAERDAGSWFGPAFTGERVPSLEAVVKELARLGLGANVEIKPAPGLATQTAVSALSVLRADWPDSLDPPLISSFNREALAAAQDRAPELPRGLLIERVPEDWRDALARLDCATLHPSRKGLDLAVVDEAKAAGFGVAVYTVNDPEEARHLLGAGVDAVITDLPDDILERI